MARSNFDFKIDVTQIEALADRLAGFTPEQINSLIVDGINDTVDSAYELSIKTMLRGINLTEEYLTRKMRVDHATAQKPSASIVAFGGRGNLTSLSHYGAMQLTEDVRWSNDRIAAAGHKFGKWPGWTKRTGSAALGIAADKKAAGRSVEVIKGQRKKLGPAFAIPGKVDGDGNQVVFTRKGETVQALTGPSVYQLFRHTAERIETVVADELQTSVMNIAQRNFMESLT